MTLPNFLRFLLLALLLVGCTVRTSPTPSPGVTSILPPPRVEVDRDIAYGQAEGNSNLLDAYYLTPEGTNRPAVILIHGGGWRDGNKGEFRSFALNLAEQGYVAFTLNYRLVRGNTNHYPAQLDDVQQAVRWVRAHASDFGVDPDRVAAMGASAGGHLASLLGLTDTRYHNDPALEAYSSRVNCVVDINGPADLTADYLTLPGNVEDLVTGLIGQPRETAPELYRQASPIHNIDEHAVPFLIVHGSDDPVVPVDESRRFYRALLAAGVDAEYLELPGEGHYFEQPENVDEFVSRVFDFLGRCLVE